MRLFELIRDEPIRLGGDAEITGLTADSREVAPGYLFAALPGSRTDGACFIDDALCRGAAALLAPSTLARGDIEIPVVLAEDPRRQLALMAARFHGRAPETVVAVTGTSGKTSVADFTRQLWQGAGRTAASIGTLGVLADDEVASITHTTPDPVTLHRELDRLAAGGVECVAIEASSHGLDQRRLDGLTIAAGAFTNFSRDHLDYHADTEAYLAAKLRLFDCVMAAGGTAVINADCTVAGRVIGACRARGLDIMTYGAGEADLRLVDIDTEGSAQRLTLEVLGRESEVCLPLPGRFQAMNAIAAVGLVLTCGGDARATVAGLAALDGVPGRLQRVAELANGARIYVDYAHKPGALENVLRALRPATRGRLVVVFGCGGDRDPGKRVEMGRIAERMADRVIVTDDNPRTEEPAAIRAEVMRGCAQAREIGERGEAIRVAIETLENGDVLVIAGKGHEQGQYIGEEIRPFDDAAEARARAREHGGWVP